MEAGSLKSMDPDPLAFLQTTMVERRPICVKSQHDRFFVEHGIPRNAVLVFEISLLNYTRDTPLAQPPAKKK